MDSHVQSQSPHSSSRESAHALVFVEIQNKSSTLVMALPDILVSRVPEAGLRIDAARASVPEFFVLNCRISVERLYRPRQIIAIARESSLHRPWLQPETNRQPT